MWEESKVAVGRGVDRDEGVVIEEVCEGGRGKRQIQVKIGANEEVVGGTVNCGEKGPQVIITSSSGGRGIRGPVHRK